MSFYAILVINEHSCAHEIMEREETFDLLNDRNGFISGVKIVLVCCAFTNIILSALPEACNGMLKLDKLLCLNCIAG